MASLGRNINYTLNITHKTNPKLHALNNIQNTSNSCLIETNSCCLYTVLVYNITQKSDTSVMKTHTESGHCLNNVQGMVSIQPGQGEKRERIIF